VLAPAILAALPSTRAIPDRDVFYVAHPARSIQLSAFVPMPGIANEIALSSAASVFACSGVSSTSGGGRTVRHTGAATYDQIQTRVSAFHYRKAI